MKKTALLFCAALCGLLVALCAVRESSAASVGPAGYTNSFASHPPATEWATLSIGGGGGDTYDLDTDVNAIITASGVTAQPAENSGNPPAAGQIAYWSSTGLYLQTRPSQNRYTVLMGKFVNNTGTNATQVRLSYVMTFSGPTAPEEKGTRVYYSLTGAANSWANLPALNSTANTGSYPLSTNVLLNWTNGGTLYVLFADDNANSGTDEGCQFDNFSLRVTAGEPPGFACRLNTPTNGTVFVSSAAIGVQAVPVNGTPSYTVEYFTNAGAGNLMFVSAGVVSAPPYIQSLGTVPAGTYNIFAVATDGAGIPLSTNSATNTFYVADPISFIMTAPTNDATFTDTSNVFGSATVAGGTAPYSVQFYLDNVAHGAPIIAPPYDLDFGNLFVGGHTIRAAVRDAIGWLSNSLISTVHITGPLGAALIPTNGSSFNYGQSITLTAIVAGGVAPYTASFFLNDQLLASFATPPFATNLGLLPAGSYTSYVYATDSSLPAPQQTYSSTNIFTIVPNPLLVTLTAPTNGQGGTAYQTLVLSASVTVNSPVAATNVTFFVDGIIAITDLTVPYIIGLGNLGPGSHTAYARATDNLGRQSFSATNIFTLAEPPGPILSYRFHELSGSIATNSGSGIGMNGAYNSVTLGTPGPRPPEVPGFESDNRAPTFNGTSGYVAGPPGLMNNRSAFTIAGWVNFASSPAARAGLFGQDSVVEFGFNTASTLQCFTGSGDAVTVSYTPPLNTWVHILTVGDGSTLRLYINGIFRGNGGFATPSYGNSSGSFNIGGGGIFDPSGNFHHGQIDEVRMYDRALSIPEIAALAAGGPMGTNASAPVISSVLPAPGEVSALTNVTVTFNEAVQNVDAADLLLNGAPTASVSGASNVWRFSFPQPSYGAVQFTWATNHGITDFDNPAKPFDATATNTMFSYNLFNPSAPIVSAQIPPAGSIVTGLTQIVVVFNEPVGGVDASDLLVNDVTASSVINATSDIYIFSVTQPAFGPVAIRWATNHGIHDLDIAANDFDASRATNQWNYTLVRPEPTVALISPTNGTLALAPANVSLRAIAADNDGFITRVEFFEGVNKIGEAINAPYVATWLNVPENNYTLRAVATDNTGLTSTSAPVVLNVVTSLPLVLLRGPYLLAGSSTGGVVRWRTDQFSAGVVFYGTDANNLTNVAAETTLTNDHLVAIRGLEPDSKYFYSIGSSGQTLAGGTNVGGTNFWFSTSPVAGTPKPTRFWVLGDSGTANINARAVRDAYYNFAGASGRAADFWLMLGDNAYNTGTDSEHQTAVFEMYPATLRNLFLWPVLGNHESAFSYEATQFPYLDIFSTPQNGEAGGLPSGSGKYYSFDYANIHFVGLDSMTSTRSAYQPDGGMVAQRSGGFDPNVDRRLLPSSALHERQSQLGCRNGLDRDAAEHRPDSRSRRRGSRAERTQPLLRTLVPHQRPLRLFRHAFAGHENQRGRRSGEWRGCLPKEHGR